MTAPLLAIKNLEVHYGDLIGVSDVSLDVPEGSVVVLPAPLEPSSATMEPCATCSDTSDTPIRSP